MRKYKNFSTVILAGGESRRLGGRDKSQLIVAGRTILEKNIESLKEIFPEIIIVTNEKRGYAFPGVNPVREQNFLTPSAKAGGHRLKLANFSNGVKVICDEFKGRGPLGGIHAGLKAIEKKGAFFWACDMPFLHNGLILRLVDCFEKQDCAAVVPRHNGYIEPLYAVYRKELKDGLSEFLQKNNGSSVRDFLKTVNTYYLDLEAGCDWDNVFKNINTPEDLAEVNNNESAF